MSALLLVSILTLKIIHLNGVPNIIFMLIDDLGWNDIGFHKGSDYLTPNIDKLASTALKLNNYYIQHICSPTRSALVSGLYPIHTGLQDSVIWPTSPYGLPLDLTIIPQDLKKIGYDTHMIGKWHLGFFTPDYLPTSRGFDTYFGYLTGGEDYFIHNHTYKNDTGYDLRNYTQPITKYNQYSTYLYGNETMRILQKHVNDKKDNPIFIYLPFQAVHGPLEAPQYIIDSFNKTISNPKRQAKAAMVTVLDYVVGDIVEYLKSSESNNIWNNTILIFSTDNGGPVGKNGDDGANNFPLRGSKHTLWEGGVKGTGFVTGGWLNDDRRGKEMNALMHITDWYPTLCSILGITASNASMLDGYDQSNNIQNGETDIYSPRSEILHNIDPVGCNLTICGAVRQKQYKLVVGWEVFVTKPLCDSTWCPLTDVNQNLTTIQCTTNNGNYNFPNATKHYINNNCPYNGEPCLYDIVSDPCEYYDIKSNEVSIYNKLYNLLLLYNNTMVTPLNLIYPQNDTAANPANLDGFWGPWVNNSNFTITSTKSEL